MSLLTAKNVSYFYQDGDTRRYILRDVSYGFEKGKFYTILGESGSGKTTFLSLITALDEPKTGAILYGNEDIKKIGYDKYRRNKVGIVFQEYNLIQYMTGLENILVAMSITENTLPQNKEEVALNLLDYMGIDKVKAKRPVNKLSGGERQRVAIARALATNVDLIVADEPTGNLDEDKENELIEIFKKLARDHNKCLIVVTHSREVADKSDQIIRLKKGIFSVDE
ncbi:MAG: ABC transporter ATP-binding protein [Oscillospiraceae bacterium]|nr:ABC transporter ATP-binding protein [Oscillospiraceae bacterium]